MADVNITSKYLNQDKREAEAITVTLPAVSNVGGGRSQRSPVYNQFGDVHTAYVVPAGSIIQKNYLIVEEAFPAGALGKVSVNGVVVHTAINLAVVGMTTSITEDLYVPVDATVAVTVSGGTGDILTGLLKSVTETIPFNEKNGRYSSYPHSNDHTQSR